MTAAPAKQKKTPQRRWLWVTLAVVFIIIIGLAGLLAYQVSAYRDSVIPGVRLAGRAQAGLMSRLSQSSLESLLATYQRDIDDQGFMFEFQTRKANLPSLVQSTVDPDLSQQLFSVDITATKDAVWSYGHHASFGRNAQDVIRAFFIGIDVPVRYSLNRDGVKKVLQENFKEYDNPATNPKITVQSNGTISVTPEQSGETLDYDQALSELSAQIETLDNETITLKKIYDQPTITVDEISSARTDLTALIKTLPWTLSYEDKRWAITVAEVTHWFRFSRRDDGSVTFDFDPAGVAQFLDATPGPILNVEAKEGKFKIDNGRVTEFQVSTPGQHIDLDKTVANLNEAMIINGATESPIAIQTTEPQSKETDVNELGITELVAEGRTDFRGSPANRVHNITVGAETLNGLVIKPGEEFSLIKALGKIDASTGYKSELVIKGNKTVPEYGGGLCQIGTTFFRLVLNTGLPVLERQNHSYRVSYYEPPVGKDATIYDPKPDFRFTNDYDHHLLLQTRIEGTQLIFEFYGTKDARTIEQTDPKVYNYVSPGPTKMVETEDLAPGEKKCTEKAHTGADAEFTYTVTYPNGEVKPTVFKSHYKAWPAVCLVGKQPSAPETPPVEPPVTNTNTNTNLNANVNTNSNANTNTTTNTNTNSNANVNAETP
ncbi:MAG: VanW family protein [Patescibacteria group bacterium]